NCNILLRSRTAGTHSPKRDFGFADGKTVILTGLQTWSGGRYAFHIADLPAMGAAQVGVVIADTQFVQSHRPGRLDATQDAGSGEITQDVIHRLHRSAR